MSIASCHSAFLPLLIGLASCVTAPPVEHHVDPGPPPIIELTLDVRGNRIGLVGAYGGPMCEGPISGVVTVRDPAGREQRIEVQEVQTYEDVCQGCDPVPGRPESCDDACEHRPMELIELGYGPFLGPGRYHVSGDGLVLACAPDHTRFVAIDVDVDQQGFTRVAAPGSPPPPVVSVQPVPKTDETTATDLWTQRSPTPPVTETEVEGLVLPVQGYDPKLRRTATAWGPLWTQHGGTSDRFLSGDDGPYGVTVAVGSDGHEGPLRLDGRPHVVVLRIDPTSSEAIRAAQGAGIFASSWTTRDAGGGDALAIDVGVALDDAKVRWEALIERSGAEVEAALSEAAAQSDGEPYGKEQTTVDQRFAPTWLPEKTQLRVRYVQRVTRSSTRQVEVLDCPQNRPGKCRKQKVPDVRAHHADLGLQVVYDGDGRVVQAQRLGPTPVPFRN